MFYEYMGQVPEKKLMIKLMMIIGSNDRTRVTSNYSLIVTTSLSYTISEILAVIAPNIVKVP